MSVAASALSPVAALAELWRTVGLDPTALQFAQLKGQEPVLPSSFAVGTAAQASVAAAALAAASLWALRGGQWQSVSVDMRHAAAEFRSERYVRVEGKPGAEPWDKIAGVYRCGDGACVRLHTNFPHHRHGVLRLLDCAYSRESVAAALAAWRAADFEDAAAERGLVATMLRSFDQWDAHEQGRAVAQLPPLTIEHIGEAPPQPLPQAPRPLAGVRVLDLTRIIAGPVAGRSLAAHGADVLLVTSPKLPAIETLVIDTGRGKRSCYLDLTQSTDRESLERLLKSADVFIQGYRPGGLEALGFGWERAAALRPGIVYASLSAYSHIGPWAGRRGFDSLVQTASGFNRAEAAAAGQVEPRPLPAQALDHASGYLIALGVIAALHRRITVGGSWHVRVSLAQTGLWLRRLGRLQDGLAAPDPALADVQEYLEESASGFGRLRAVRHSASLTTTPAAWTQPSVPLGTHAPAW